MKFCADVAQLVEHRVDNAVVGGSIPSVRTIFGRVVERYTRRSQKPISERIASSSLASTTKFSGRVVKLADTLVLEASASAWGFKSLLGYHPSVVKLVNATDLKSVLGKLGCWFKSSQRDHFIFVCIYAAVAQMVEQSPCKRLVGSSILSSGSILISVANATFLKHTFMRITKIRYKYTEVLWQPYFVAYG